MTASLERERPASAEAIADVVARADASGSAVCIAAGGTLSGMGLPPSRAALTLDVTGVAGIADYAPADLVAGVLAGTTVQSFATSLAQHGQFVPFDAPQPARATIGGTLAAGWLGPRRHLYGRPRDYLLGTTAVLADGTIVRAGGMVVKNVAGYDMSRLYAGSFGTLAVLVRANLKTLPLPRRVRALTARIPEKTRERACAALLGLAIPPAAAWWAEGFVQHVDGDEGAEGRLLVVLEGSDAVVERATRELRSALGRAGVPESRVLDAGARETFQRAVDAYLATLGERSITYRIAAFPDESHGIAAGAREIAKDAELRPELLVDVMNGDVVLRVSDLDARSLGAKIEGFDEALHERCARAQVIAGEHPHRASLDVWGAPPPAIERMRALKQRFDPKGTLNPGRFVGGL